METIIKLVHLSPPRPAPLLLASPSAQMASSQNKGGEGKDKARDRVALHRGVHARRAWQVERSALCRVTLRRRVRARRYLRRETLRRAIHARRDLLDERRALHRATIRHQVHARRA